VVLRREQDIDLRRFARASQARHYAGMIALTDNQLKIVTDAARLVPGREA
jgi:hypothetical protein